MKAAQAAKVKKPRILIVTPEITYLPEGMGNLAGKMTAKAGGMADVSASLVGALFDLGADVHVALPHYRRLLSVARDRLGKKARAEFVREIGEVEERWFLSLSEDVSAFCRSFDYRAEEPLTEEQKSAVERAVKGLSGLEGREVKPC